MPIFNSMEVLCHNCGKTMLAQPNQLEHGEKKYCSYACRNTHKRRPLADRLWEKVDKSGGPESCWPYTTITHDTYGLIYYLTEEGKRRTIGTHCAAFFVTHGFLPQDRHIMVLHKCGYKRCCNPAHLYLGDGHDNAMDAIADGVWHGNTKLAEGDAKAIRLLYGILTTEQICDKFHISQGTFSSIIMGRSHKNAGGPIKQNNNPTQTHCHKGHPFTEDNIVYTHGDKQFRQCRICYMEGNRVKSRRRLETKRTEINTQRRARRGSTVRRFTDEECAHIKTLYPQHSYRAIADMFDGATYGTIERIVKGTYAGTRLAH